MAWLQGNSEGSMNLLLSGSGGRWRGGAGGWGFHAGEKKTLDGYRSLISCYSNQSLDFQVPRLWQSSSSFSFFFFKCVFFLFCFWFFLMGNRESETAAHRKRKGMIGQRWSLDADVPIPKRLYIILRTLSSTEWWHLSLQLSKGTVNVYTISYELAGLHADFFFLLFSNKKLNPVFQVRTLTCFSATKLKQKKKVLTKQKLEIKWCSRGLETQ